MIFIPYECYLGSLGAAGWAVLLSEKKFFSSLAGERTSLAETQNAAGTALSYCANIPLPFKTCSTATVGTNWLLLTRKHSLERLCGGRARSPLG